KKLIGKPAAFRGTVSTVFSPSSHSITILGFASNRRLALHAVVRPSDYRKFPDLSTLQGKEVLITGTFSTYRAGRLSTNPDELQLDLPRRLWGSPRVRATELAPSSYPFHIELTEPSQVRII